MQKLIKEVIKETSLIDWLIAFVVVISWFISMFYYRTKYELIAFTIAMLITIASFKIVERKK